MPNLHFVEQVTTNLWLEQLQIWDVKWLQSNEAIKQNLQPYATPEDSGCFLNIDSGGGL